MNLLSKVNLFILLSVPVYSQNLPTYLSHQGYEDFINPGLFDSDFVMYEKADNIISIYSAAVRDTWHNSEFSHQLYNLGFKQIRYSNKISLGGQVTSDNIGPTKNTSFNIYFNYYWKLLEKSEDEYSLYLGGGLMIGSLRQQININDLVSYENENLTKFNYLNDGLSLFNGGANAYLATKHGRCTAEVGYAILQAYDTTFDSPDDERLNYDLSIHHFLNTRVYLRKDAYVPWLEAAANVKVTNSIPFHYEVNFKYHFINKFKARKISRYNNGELYNITLNLGAGISSLGDFSFHLEGSSPLKIWNTDFAKRILAGIIIRPSYRNEYYGGAIDGLLGISTFELYFKFMRF